MNFLPGFRLAFVYTESAIDHEAVRLRCCFFRSVIRVSPHYMIERKLRRLHARIRPSRGTTANERSHAGARSRRNARFFKPFRVQHALLRQG